MGVPESNGPQAGPDVSRWVDEHADVLFRYALQRVRRRDVAEDLVQETFLAALRARQGFAGQSSERTWLVGILRHKIIDHIRQSSRSRSQRQQHAEEISMDAFFDQKGHWKTGSLDWGSDPAALLEQRDFWDIFQKCFGGLPSSLAETFMLRELEQCEPGEVCANLEISESNLWVRLHRARILLKECLEKHWFRAQSE